MRELVHEERLLLHDKELSAYREAEAKCEVKAALKAKFKEPQDEIGPGLVLDKALVDKLLRTQPRKPPRSGYSLFTGEIIAMSNSRSSKEGMRKASHNEAMIASCLVPLSPCVS